MSKTVLITGCSSGIGRELVLQLTRSGYTVIATARRAETLADLPAAMKLPLDVRQAELINQAVDHVIQRFGRIDVLINNAGYAVRGAVEEVAVEQAQQMFDVNVFGVMRMIRAVAPTMRQQKNGRIINISSVSGKLVTPANGTYSATKFALEALSDALRLELSCFGIQVIIVEPGSIKTQFHNTVEANGRAIFSDPASPYRSLYAQYEKVDSDMRRKEPGPEAVSQVVRQAIEAAHPKARYLAGFPITGRLVIRLSDTLWEPVVSQMFKIRS